MDGEGAEVKANGDQGGEGGGRPAAPARERVAVGEEEDGSGGEEEEGDQDDVEAMGERKVRPRENGQEAGGEGERLRPPGYRGARFRGGGV